MRAEAHPNPPGTLGPSAVRLVTHISLWTEARVCQRRREREWDTDVMIDPVISHMASVLRGRRGNERRTRQEEREQTES